LDIQTIGVILAATSVTIAAAYYVLSLHNQNQTRQAQLFMNLYNSTTDKEFLRHAMEHIFQWNYSDLDDFEEKYGLESNPEENTYWHLEINFIESTAILVNRGLVPVSLVDSWVGDWFIVHWEKFSPYIREFRVRNKLPGVWMENEALIKKLKEYRMKNPSRLLSITLSPPPSC